MRWAAGASDLPLCHFSDRVAEFRSAETRQIGWLPGNTVLAESEGRGWRDIHASLANVTTWSGAHPAHAHHCLAYCVSQPAYLRRRLAGRRDEEVTLRPRQFFVIPRGQSSEWYRRGRTQMLMIYLRQDLLDTVARELGSQGGAGTAEVDLAPGTMDAFLEQFALAVLHTLLAVEDGGSALYVEALARSAAVHLLRRHGSRTGAKPIPPGRSAANGPDLRRIADYIEAELGGDLSLAALAQVANLPVNAFGRVFREAYGASPHQYILAKRVERAKALLLATDLPIAEIALETGFSSQSHLTTAFGRFTGVPPAEFRRVSNG
ncbi:helix-turn-helix domain-containing protein [Methylobacterium aquaticum]|uniref:helix-turn-helix domain-containing protein n=1 Tax=Methylobacterium aquaticum TaxID=270351 RepID=UPI0012E108BC|nr:AraC family transcriptional regulator [Methylobacterium aquaticum]